MRLAAAGHPHLTYCTNIHAGETWDEVRRNLERYVVRVKALVAPDRPFGVGLRLSAQAAEDLTKPGVLGEFAAWLRTSGLYVFTVNGFPYGPFHGVPVKEQVYLPDWLDPARLVYTDRLATLLAELLPEEPGLEGTVSTAPGAFKARVKDEADAGRMADAMIRHVATLHRLREQTGKTISLAIEPEPCCHLETVAETVDYFERHLVSRTARDRLTQLTGLGGAESEATLRRHLTVCFDACHMAVEFEEPRAALNAFAAAGVRIGKFQISAGLKVNLDTRAGERLAALRPFAEGVYLHQVVERSGGRFTRYLDLPEALEAAKRWQGGDREWHVHFHVPLFREDLGAFVNTQDYLRELLGMLRRDCPSQHLEVETYTWDVLPEEYRREDIVTAVARELRWVEERMTTT
jgi:sugar phosphate isomerase/epimerase